MPPASPARPHHVKDGVIQPGDGRASAALGTTVDRVTDVGPGSGTEEQDAGGGACVGEKSCPRSSYRWLCADPLIAVLWVIFILMCN